ncbi:type II secretion system F family protein [Candidatus Poriferisodalis sp.]|uniref:type II secretion system F family protein n=1 Tax=Candidatus Poriferisodalis sp. TaxID=3101277 RepID=UPI003B529CE4
MTGGLFAALADGAWKSSVADGSAWVSALAAGPAWMSSLAASPVLGSVVLSNPLVIGGLAAAAVCWGGAVTRPDPGRRRVLQLAPVEFPARSARSTGAAVAGRAVAGRVAWPRRGDIPRPDHVVADLGTIVDVMNVALTSGLSISASLQLAVSHLDGASGTGRLLGALATPQRPLDEALEEFGRTCGPRARAFAGAVTGSLRTGIPLAPELERLGRELREDRRRRLEGKVRRLPVLLLFPLVLCVLPALGLIAIVPVLVAAFGG